MELKLKKMPRNGNVKFEMCFQDGCDYDTYPYDTDKYCQAVDEIWSLNLRKPNRKRGPKNPRRQMTRMQRNWPDTPDRPNPQRHPRQQRQDHEEEEKLGQTKRR